MKIPSIRIKIPKIKVYGIDVIKNALFFIIYIFLTLFIIAFILSPSIKTFKKEKNNYYIIKSEFDEVNNEYLELLKEVNTLKEKNKNVLMKLRRDFDLNNFKLFAKDYMEIIKIKKLPKKEKNKFEIYPYLITAKIPSPKNFYEFIDNSKNYKNIIRGYFPIDFEKSNEEINLTFKIEVYKLKQNLNILKKVLNES